jgi:hypothetical protein
MSWIPDWEKLVAVVVSLPFLYIFRRALMYFVFLVFLTIIKYSIFLIIIIVTIYLILSKFL